VFLLNIVAIACLSSQAFAQDDVVHRRNGIVTRGKIISSDASGLKLRLDNGKDILVPADQIERIEVKLLPDHQEGDRLFEQQDYRAAAARFEAVFKAETRAWLRSKIASNIVACYVAAGDPSAAIDAFFIASQATDGQITWSAVPVWWLPEPPAGPVIDQATTMLRSGSPIEQVIGASFLFGTKESPAAREALARLTTYRDERIGQLARTQLWRWDAGAAKPDEIDSWQRQAAKLPTGMRAGPYFAIGQALRRLGKHDEAALAFLWPALVYHNDPKLSGRAALYAAESLEQAKQFGEARQIYEEVVSRFARTPDATTAQARLAALKE
jgi:tetratricopeptide (TPR) repeat protein